MQMISTWTLGNWVGAQIYVRPNWEEEVCRTWAKCKSRTVLWTCSHAVYRVQRSLSVVLSSEVLTVLMALMVNSAIRFVWMNLYDHLDLLLDMSMFHQPIIIIMIHTLNFFNFIGYSNLYRFFVVKWDVKPGVWKQSIRTVIVDMVTFVLHELKFSHWSIPN